MNITLESFSNYFVHKVNIKYGKWKITFSQFILYEFKNMSVGRATKNIQGIYLDHAATFKAVKKLFCWFGNGNLDLNDKISPGRASGRQWIRDLANNSVQIL